MICIYIRNINVCIYVYIYFTSLSLKISAGIPLLNYLVFVTSCDVAVQFGQVMPGVVIV